MGILLFIVISAIIASTPSLLLWLLAWSLSPHAYALPPLQMTGLCVVLAFLTSTVLNLELEMGMFSVAPIMLVLTLFWTLVLLPAGVLAKYFYANRTGKKS